jgi:hypothetical protein
MRKRTSLQNNMNEFLNASSMKHAVSSFLVLSLLASCGSEKNAEQTTLPAGVHKAVVEEALQTTQYTYLHVKDGDHESWLAVTKMQASPGDTYYFNDALPMNNFESKELKRTFPEIYFLDQLSSTPAIVIKTTAPVAPVQSVAEAGIAADNNSTILTSDTPIGKTNHAVLAQEVLQTSKYTYIRGTEAKDERWLATSRMEAKTGLTYYFNGGLPMTDFVSKELNRSFKQILFVDHISTLAPGTEAPEVKQAGQVKSSGSAINLEKKDVKMKHEKGDITIAVIQENRKTYAGKIIRIKGQVTKYNAGIMKKNWIHLQDGTEWSGKFDLTITTDQEVKVGDWITTEGIINVDKDFGFGYFYEVLMEDAKFVK